MSDELNTIKLALKESGLRDYDITLERADHGEQAVIYLVCNTEVPPFRMATIYENNDLYDAELIAQIFAETAFVQEELIGRLFSRLKEATVAYDGLKQVGMAKWLGKEIMRRRSAGKDIDALLEMLNTTLLGL